jgi:hypothetical protein
LYVPGLPASEIFTADILAQSPLAPASASVQSSQDAANIPEQPTSIREERQVPNLVGSTVVIDGQIFVPRQTIPLSSGRFLDENNASPQQPDLGTLDLEELCFIAL